MAADELLAGAGRTLRAGARRQRWFSDPARFAREVFRWPEGESLTDYQGRAMQTAAESGRLALRSPHGAGKTTVAAQMLLWHSITRNSAGISWKSLAVAGSWRQLQFYLMPELHRWEHRIRWDVLGVPAWREGKQSFDLGLRLSHGELLAGASDDAALLEGLHADSVFLCLDESKSIPDATWDAVEGALSGPGEKFALAVSTPGQSEGRFYSIHQRAAGLLDWQVQHVTLAEAIDAGRVSPDWVEARRTQWGEASSVFQQRVLGEFSSGDADSLVPLQWVEEANARWLAWHEQGRPQPGGRLVVAADIARFGGDQTCLVSRRGDVVLAVETFGQLDTMAVVGEIVRRLQQPSDIAIVDEIGVGAGVLDRLREQRKNCLGFNASSASPGHDRSGQLGFLNRRAAAWFELKQLLDPAAGARLCLPPDDQLTGDLVAPRWNLTSSGKVQIEAKADIRRRLGRSPDAGDSLAMSLTIGSSAGSAATVVKFDPTARPRQGDAVKGTWHRPRPGSASEDFYDPAWGSGSLFLPPASPEPPVRRYGPGTFGPDGIVP